MLPLSSTHTVAPQPPIDLQYEGGLERSVAVNELCLAHCLQAPGPSS